MEPLRLLGKHQLAALAATAVDFGMMVALVESHATGPVLATAIGAVCGAITNFLLGRNWIFPGATIARVQAQAIRYGMVSATSLGLNALGVFVLSTLFLVPYLLSRLAIALIVSIGWNFPLHRHFVFRHQETELPS